MHTGREREARQMLSDDDDDRSDDEGTVKCVEEGSTEKSQASNEISLLSMIETLTNERERQTGSQEERDRRESEKE